MPSALTDYSFLRNKALILVPFHLYDNYLITQSKDCSKCHTKEALTARLSVSSDPLSAHCAALSVSCTVGGSQEERRRNTPHNNNKQGEENIMCFSVSNSSRQFSKYYSRSSSEIPAVLMPQFLLMLGERFVFKLH